MLAFLLVTMIFSTTALAEEETLDIKWVEGPSNVALEDMATINLPDQFLFANKADTVKLMEYFGNPSSNAELGSVFPKSENENWFIIFEYFEVGHVKDDDKDKINADDLLASMKKGTEEANKERAKNDIPPLTITGWLEQPNYNEDLHSLVWCVLCESENGKSANYESRLLCREGYVSATLVCSDEELEAVKPYLKQVVDKFRFNEGKRYEDYVKGKDKLSDLGLAALIVGGSAVAVKKGILVALLVILKKGGILIFIPIIAFFKRLFGRKKRAAQEMQMVDTGSETSDNESSQINDDFAVSGHNILNEASEESLAANEDNGLEDDGSANDDLDSSDDAGSQEETDNKDE